MIAIDYSHTYQDTSILKVNLNLKDEHPLVLYIELYEIIFSSFSTPSLPYDVALIGVSRVLFV
jgi:hypothetical protein